MAADSAFKTNQSIPLGEMEVEFVLDGRWVSAQAKAVEKLFPRPKVVFEVSGRTARTSMHRKDPSPDLLNFRYGVPQ